MVFRPRGPARRQPNCAPNMNQDYDPFGDNMAQGQHMGGNMGNMGRSAPSMPSRNPYTTYENQRPPRPQHYGAQPAPNAPKVGRPFNPRGPRPQGDMRNPCQQYASSNAPSFAHAGAPSPAGRKPFSDQQRAPRGMPVDSNMPPPHLQAHGAQSPLHNRNVHQQNIPHYNPNRGMRPPMARPTLGHTPQQHQQQQQQPQQQPQRPAQQQRPMHPRARPMLRHPRVGTPVRVDGGARHDMHEHNEDANLEQRAPKMSKAAPAATNAMRHSGGGNPPPGVFGIGATVQVDGLVSAAKYNGCEGRVSNFFPDKQRWEVTLNFECETKVLALKRSNCILRPSCGWTVLVSNCPPARIEELSPHFALFGIIKKIELHVNFACCLVEYVTRAGALACLKEKQQEVLGEPIIVQWLPSLKREMNLRDIKIRGDTEKDDASRPSGDRRRRRSRDAHSDDDAGRKKPRTEDDKDYLSEEEVGRKTAAADRKSVAPTADNVHDDPFATAGECSKDADVGQHGGEDGAGAGGVGDGACDQYDDGGDYEDYEDYEDEELEAGEAQVSEQPGCDTEELLEELAGASEAPRAQRAEVPDDNNDLEAPPSDANPPEAATATVDVGEAPAEEKPNEAEEKPANEENAGGTAEEDKENTGEDLKRTAEEEALKVEDDGLPDDEQVERPRKRARVSKWENEQPAETLDPQPVPPLPSVDEIKAMSIKSLKELLTARNVDFTGCLEKPEIREKALRLHTA